MSICIWYSSSKLVHLFTLHCLCVLDLVKLCKYYNFHSEIYFNNTFKNVLSSSVICSGTLYSKEPGGFQISTYNIILNFKLYLFVQCIV